MRTKRWTWPVLLAAFVAACEAGPTDPAATVGDDDFHATQAILASVVSANWDALASEAGIEGAIETAAAAPAAPGEARALLALARDARVEALAALESGDLVRSRELATEAFGHVLEAAVVLFGGALADDVVDGATRVLEALRAATADRGASGDAIRSLDDIESLLSAARDARAAGDPVRALREGVRGSESMRELSPERLAARWIGHAEALLARAQHAAGPNPQPPISAWLDAAAHLLGQAKSAFEQGDYQAAIAHAQASAASSRRVLDALAPEPDPVDLEELAARTIAVAEDLLETAVRLAGDDPRERIAAAIEDARSLLAQAKDAFGARDFREAVGLARQSAARSSMVIRALSGDGSGGTTRG